VHGFVSSLGAERRLPLTQSPKWTGFVATDQVTCHTPLPPNLLSNQPEATGSTEPIPLAAAAGRCATMKRASPVQTLGSGSTSPRDAEPVRRPMAKAPGTRHVLEQGASRSGTPALAREMDPRAAGQPPAMRRAYPDPGPLLQAAARSTFQTGPAVPPSRGSRQPPPPGRRRINSRISISSTCPRPAAATSDVLIHGEGRGRAAPASCGSSRVTGVLVLARTSGDQ